MKLHIECLQEKLDAVSKERDILRKTNDNSVSEHSNNMDKLNKIIKTLEEELSNKAEKIKAQDSKLNEYKDDNMTMIEKIKELQK